MSLSSNFPIIKPSLNLDFANVGTLDPRITFTRASTATYYDTQTAKAEENLLTRSQEFNLWTLSNVTVGTDTDTAPDGTTTAEALKEDSATASHRMQQPATLSLAASTVYTMSIFVKQKTGSRFATIGFNSDGSNWASATFDLSAGTNTQTLSAGFTSVSATITASVSSWYRVTLTATTNASASASALVLIGLSATSTFVSSSRGFDSYAGNNTSEILYWGAQLEQRSTATAYTPTTTQAITNYIPVLETAASGVARFDHNPTTFESLGLLIEEQRTNLWAQSEDFSNASWTKVRSSITADAAVSPAGTVTADKLIANTDNNTHFIRQDIAVTSGTSYTQTIYAKAAEYSQIQMNFDTDNSAFAIGTAVFTLTGNGSVSTSGTLSSSSITLVGNGWYRCQISAPATATTTGVFRIYAANGGVASFAGDGYSGVYLWGAQLEAGAFATSYIPTTTTALTRSADAATMTGTNFSSWYNASEGTLFANFVPSIATSCAVLGIDSGVSTSQDSILVQVLSGSTLTGRVRYPGTTDAAALALGSLTANSQTKIAFSYKTNDFAGTLNAAAVVTDASGSVVPSPIRLFVGSNSFVNTVNGTISRIAYYPTRLPDAQLQALTG